MCIAMATETLGAALGRPADQEERPQRSPSGHESPASGGDHGIRRLRLEAAIGFALSALLGGLAGATGLGLVGGWWIPGVVVAIAACAAGWAWRRVGRQLSFLSEVVEVAADLAAGSKLRPIDESKLGSLVGVGRSFNGIFDTLGGVAQDVLGVVSRVQDLPARLTVSLRQIDEGAQAQEAAVEESASLMANINSSIRTINERVERLSRAAEESSSSILEMESSVDEVARNAEALQESVDTPTSSVHEMSASIRQVAQSSENVQAIAEETAASVIQMDRSVQEVSGHVQHASELAEKVAEGAAKGATAVDETIQDIQRIHSLTTDAKTGLEKLVGRISEIAQILGVIGEINDETNLLSLNAAIIAAQAGEQGKAFLVVANHVKTLARRTASSTKDIEQLLRSVEQESDNAMTAMGAGIEAIDQGVSRSRLAGRSLAEIQTSARESSQRVSEIARASEEQTRTSGLVAHSAQETSNQVQQISIAMTEQTKASEQMLQSSEAALELCSHVCRSMEEQRETGRYIAQSISQITDMIQLVRENTAQHGETSAAVNESVLRLLENARKTGEQIPKVNSMLSDLRANTEEIVSELSRFEVTPKAFR